MMIKRATYGMIFLCLLVFIGFVHIKYLHCAISRVDASIKNEIINKLSKIDTYKVEHCIERKGKETQFVTIFHRKKPYAVRREYLIKNKQAIDIINTDKMFTIIPAQKYVFVSKTGSPDVELEEYLKRLKEYRIEELSYFGQSKRVIVFDHKLKVPRKYRKNDKVEFKRMYYVDADAGLLLKTSHYNWGGGIIKEEIARNYELNPSLEDSLFKFEIPPDYQIIGMVPKDE